MELIKKPMRPSIFEYSDYRVFLYDLYSHYKQVYPYFSYRYFSKKAGFASPNILKLVIDGQRNISPKSVHKFIGGLKLTSEEAEFFVQLVAFCQSGSSVEKAQHANAILKSKSFKKVHTLKQAELKYYGRWYYIPIRELVGTNTFREDLSWIVRQFRPPISELEVSEAIKDLHELGLIHRDSNGELVQTHKNVRTEGEIVSTFVTQYHKTMIAKASDSIEEIPANQREISATCISMSKNNVDKIKKLVREFRKEIMTLAEEDSHTDSVYQLNFQLYPLVGGFEEEKN